MQKSDEVPRGRLAALVFGASSRTKVIAKITAALVLLAGMSVLIPEGRHEDDTIRAFIQASVVKAVMAPEGQVTEAVHQLFWQESTAIEAVAPLLDTARRSLLFSRATWLAVGRSAAAGREVRHEDLALRRTALAGTGQVEEQGAVNESDAMIAAAAAGTPWKLADGTVVTLTPGHADRMLTVIEGALQRLEQLADPNWRPGQRDV